MKTVRRPTVNLSPAHLAAQNAFKTGAMPLTSEQMEAQAVEANRQRLKALRLARDAAIDGK
jgi:hypothetical protein